MIYGASYSKFEVYTDSGLGTLTETINLNYNLGSFSGVSGESQNTPMKRRDLKYENPFTFSKTRVFVGYHYDAVLNIESGDHYYPGAVSQAEDFAAEQATPRETDVHKAFRLVDYANANYYILFTPHVDQAYVYGFTRYYVDLEIVGFSHGDTVRADKCQLHVEGFSLLTGTNAAPAQGQSARFAFGNCLSFASASSHHCTLTELNLSTTHTIECWFDGDSGTNKYISSGSSDSSYFGFSASTTFEYSAGILISQGVWSVSATSAGTKNHYLITRSGTSVTLYVNGISKGTQTINANNDFKLDRIARSGANYWTVKIGRLRCHSYAFSAAQIALAYNRGYGNYASSLLYGTRAALWEMQGSGTTETDLGDAGTHTLTLVNGVTRPVF